MLVRDESFGSKSALRASLWASIIRTSCGLDFTIANTQIPIDWDVWRYSNIALDMHNHSTASIHGMV